MLRLHFLYYLLMNPVLPLSPRDVVGEGFFIHLLRVEAVLQALGNGVVVLFQISENGRRGHDEQVLLKKHERLCSLFVLLLQRSGLTTKMNT